MEPLPLDRRGTVERLVADPAFVVLPKVPDLTCDDCKGKSTLAIGTTPATSPLDTYIP